MTRYNICVYIVCNYMNICCHVIWCHYPQYTFTDLHVYINMIYVVLVRQRGSKPNLVVWKQVELPAMECMLRLKPNSRTFYCPAFEAWWLRQRRFAWKQPYPIIIPCKNAVFFGDDSFSLLKWFLFRFSCLFMCRGYHGNPFHLFGASQAISTRSTATRSLSLESP